MNTIKTVANLTCSRRSSGTIGFTVGDEITRGMEDSYRIFIFYKERDSLDRETFEKKIVAGSVYD